jgi:hypothetical protein
VLFKIGALAALSVAFLLGQTETPAAPADTAAALSADTSAALSAPAPAAGSREAVPSRLRADESDPLVVRARERSEQVRKLVSAGALPLMRFKKAQDEVQDALDMSLLRQSLSIIDLLPEEADQMVVVAQRMVIRRQRSLIEMQELVSAGIISKSEAETSTADFDRAQKELDWAKSRATLVEQIAENARIQKSIASMEVQAESHPDWAGKVYTHYDGNGIFTPADLQRLELDYAGKFGRKLPISAEGETAVHRSLGFDHRGRVDVAVMPDQPEGEWLMHYLEGKKIPYFAFRMAVPGKATGAHIHVGPQSTRLALTD